MEKEYTDCTHQCFKCSNIYCTQFVTNNEQFTVMQCNENCKKCVNIYCNYTNTIRTKILWFSQHDMTEPQEKDLVRIFGDIEIHQVNATIKNVDELPLEFDVFAVVMPVELQAELFKKLNSKQKLITAKNRRVRNQDGKFEFEHAGWVWIKELKLETEIL